MPLIFLAVMVLLLSVLTTIVIRVLVAVTLLVPCMPLVELPWIVIGSRVHVLEKFVT